MFVKYVTKSRHRSTYSSSFNSTSVPWESINQETYWCTIASSFALNWKPQTYLGMKKYMFVKNALNWEPQTYLGMKNYFPIKSCLSSTWPKADTYQHQQQLIQLNISHLRIHQSRYILMHHCLFIWIHLITYLFDHQLLFENMNRNAIVN
jgi:hypothetical protein